MSSSDIEAIRAAVERLAPRGVAVLSSEDLDILLRVAREEGEESLLAALRRVAAAWQDEADRLPASWTQQKRSATYDAMTHCARQLLELTEQPAVDGRAVRARLDADTADVNARADALTMQGGLPAGRVVDLAADESKARPLPLRVEVEEVLRLVEGMAQSWEKRAHSKAGYAKMATCAGELKGLVAELRTRDAQLQESQGLSAGEQQMQQELLQEAQTQLQEERELVEGLKKQLRSALDVIKTQEDKLMVVGADRDEAKAFVKQRTAELSHAHDEIDRWRAKHEAALDVIEQQKARIAENEQRWTARLQELERRLTTIVSVAAGGRR